MASFADTARMVVRCDGEKGRFAVATTFVSVGTPEAPRRVGPSVGHIYVGFAFLDDVLIEEAPVVSLVLQDYEERVCARCFQALSAGTKRFCCGECGVVRYCSDSCRMAARAVHDKECDAFIASTRAAKNSGCDVDLLRIVARLMWTKHLSGDNEHWEAANRLLSHQYDLAPAEDDARRWKESVVHGITKMRRKLPSSAGEFIDQGARWASVVNTNAHGILSRGNTGTSVGLGLFPQIAMLNHSCVPNAAYEFSRTTSHGEERVYMSVRAIAPVKEGEEVTVSYCDLLQGTPARRDRLLQEKHFRCECRRCQQDILSAFASASESQSPISSRARLDAVRSDADWLLQRLSGDATPTEYKRDQDLSMRAFDHALCAICCPQCGICGFLIPKLGVNDWTCCACEATYSEEQVKRDLHRLEDLVTRAERVPEGDVMKTALILQVLRLCTSAPETMSTVASSFADVEIDTAACSALGIGDMTSPESISLHPLHRLNLSLYMALVDECMIHGASARDVFLQRALSLLCLTCEALLPEGSAERRRFESYLSS